jgi:hypothetical protein
MRALLGFAIILTAHAQKKKGKKGFPPVLDTLAPDGFDRGPVFECCAKPWCVEPRWEYCDWNLLHPWSSNGTDVKWSFENRPGCVRRPREQRRLISDVDVDGLRSYVGAFTENDWAAAGNERAATYKVHQHTNDIRVLERPFNSINSKSEVDPLHKAKFEPLSKFIEPYVSAAKYEYGYRDIDLIRLILVRLKAGGEVLRHRDRGPGLLMSHRIHLPVFSDPGVTFQDEHLGPGRLFELHNGKLHFVNNTSPEDRVHLIMDIYPLCKKVADADSQTAASI